MSFTCSLMGHRFGDTEVEREREEDGSEVITTVREIRTCSRCGTRRVVSENTEVTTVETPSDIVGEDLEEAAETAPEGPEQPGDGESGTGSAEPEPEPTPESPTGDEPSGPGAGVGTEGTDPAEDDGIILGEDGDEDGRAPGEWPEEDREEDGGDEPDVEPVSERADPGPEQVEATSEVVTVPEGTFECPECEFSTPVEDSSLRAGDFCPECRTGALEHHRE